MNPLARLISRIVPAILTFMIYTTPELKKEVWNQYHGMETQIPGVYKGRPRYIEAWKRISELYPNRKKRIYIDYIFAIPKALFLGLCILIIQMGLLQT